MSEKYFDNTEKDDGTVVLTGDDGNVVRFFHIGTIEYKNEWFVFFQPAEPKEGIDPDEVVIFKLSGEGRDETLLPVTDDDLLSEVYDEFMGETRLLKIPKRKTAEPAKIAAAAVVKRMKTQRVATVVTAVKRIYKKNVKKFIIFFGVKH